MKNICILIFLFCLSFKSQAQTYVPFPNGQDSVAWKIVSGGWNNSQEYFQYFLGDTLLDGYNYVKVYESNNLFEENLDDIKAFVREENRKIYTRSLNNTETLLYDFNMQEGDTLTLTYSVPHNLVLLNIDSIAIENNTFRKRFQYFMFTEFGSDTVFQIEGLGNVKTGFFYPEGFDVLDFYVGTACIFSPNELYYKGATVNEEDCYVLKNNVGINDFDKTEFQVYPNPSLGSIKFTEEITNSNLQLFSISGQKVFDKRNFSGTHLDISFLKTGVYYLKLEGENNGCLKFIKL